MIQLTIGYIAFAVVAIAVYARIYRKPVSRNDPLWSYWKAEPIGAPQAFAELLLPLLFGFFIMLCAYNWNSNAISSNGPSCAGWQIVAGDTDCD